MARDNLLEGGRAATKRRGLVHPEKSGTTRLASAFRIKNGHSERCYECGAKIQAGQYAKIIYIGHVGKVIGLTCHQIHGVVPEDSPAAWRPGERARWAAIQTGHSVKV